MLEMKLHQYISNMNIVSILLSAGLAQSQFHKEMVLSQFGVQELPAQSPDLNPTQHLWDEQER